MGNRRTLLAAAAILLAAVAGLGVYFYTSGADNRAESKVQTVEAFVAVRDIPKGMTGAAALAEAPRPVSACSSRAHRRARSRLSDSRRSLRRRTASNSPRRTLS